MRVTIQVLFAMLGFSLFGRRSIHYRYAPFLSYIGCSRKKLDNAEAFAVYSVVYKKNVQVNFLQ